MAGQHYLVGDLINHDQPHHDSFEALWNTRWKTACERGTYPFAYGAIEDFEPIAEALVDIKAKEPYDWDGYAAAFAPRGRALVEAAVEAESAGDLSRAIELYHRASAVYRISRYPIPRSTKQWEAWAAGKDAFEKGQRLVAYGIRAITIPYSHKLAGEDDLIPVYAHLLDHKSPLVIIASGLDGYRTDNCILAEGLAQQGISLLVFEIPGTGDCPAFAADPDSVDRLMRSILDWCAGKALVDESQICLWGLSTGAGFALRAAHTMQEHLTGVVVQGGDIHHAFDRAWLDRVDKLEYPFDLAECLAVKFGYGEDIERFKNEAQDRFSLLKTGILDQPCARTLLINGMDDTIFPVDDLLLALQHGDAKEARFFTDVGHMGEPHATPFILRWIFELFGRRVTAEDVDRAAQTTVMPLSSHPYFVDTAMVTARDQAKQQLWTTFRTIGSMF